MANLDLDIYKPYDPKSNMSNQLIKKFNDEIKYTYTDVEGNKQEATIMGMTACVLAARMLQYGEPLSLPYCVYSPIEIW